MLFLLEVLTDSYNVYDTETQKTLLVPKNTKQVSGVFSNSVYVPYSDYEVRLSQYLEFLGVVDFDGDLPDDFGLVFDKTTMICMKSSFMGAVEYVSIFGYILNQGLSNLCVKDDTLMFNLQSTCIKFKILDIDKFTVFMTKFKCLGKEIKYKTFIYSFGSDEFQIFSENALIYSVAQEI